MSINRYSAQRDQNERSIVDALRKIGCIVHRMDWLDLFVCTPRGNVIIMEVKMPGKKLNDTRKNINGKTQKQVYDELTCNKGVVHNVEEALWLANNDVIIREQLHIRPYEAAK